jgi:hypothetical protein
MLSNGCFCKLILLCCKETMNLVLMLLWTWDLNLWTWDLNLAICEPETWICFYVQDLCMLICCCKLYWDICMLVSFGGMLSKNLTKQQNKVERSQEYNFYSNYKHHYKVKLHCILLIQYNWNY